ncbi:MAG: hypothetical protein AAFQ27_11300, partial [Pseudomonadota bacterium]
MRLAGLGILALVLVGILIVLGQSGAFDTAWQRTTGSDIQRFEDSDRSVLANFDVEGSSVFGAPVSSDNPIILSGLPSFAGVKFRLPVDARPESGDLTLAFTSLVAEDVEGVLRVTINGVKRADFLLREGERTDSVQVQLAPSDLSAGELSVGLSLQGRGPIAECTTDDAIAAVVSIDGDSGLQLNLADTPTSTRDKLALWGDRVPIGWTGQTAGASAPSTLHQAAILSQKGYQPLFADSGMATDALTTIAGEAARRSAFSVPGAYPIALSSDPTNEGLRKFTRRVNWRYSYNAADLPGDELPSALDLRLQVGPATNALERDVVVTLNNSLLFSRRVSADTERLNQSIAIPAEIQRQSNALDISISAYDADDVRCGDIAQSVAELLPETVLRGGGSALTDELATIRDLLSGTGSAALDASDLSAPDAEAASALLAGLGPSRWEVSSAAKSATVRVVSDRSAIASARRAPGMTSWVVYRDAGSGEQVRAQRLGVGNLSDVSGVALLVNIAG